MRLAVRLPALLLLLAAAAPSPEIRYFRYQRPVEIPEPATGQAPASNQVCLTLAADVFAHASPQLADLRIYRGAAETPYAIRISTAAAPSDENIAPLNLGRTSGRTTFDAAMPPGPYSDLQLAISAHDFIATVTVAGSQAQTGGPQTMLGSYTIFDLTRQKLGRSTVLHLPASNFHFLHFRIAGPIMPEAVTGLSVAQSPPAPPTYVPVAASAQIAQKGRSSVLEFAVPPHTPVDRVLVLPGAQPPSFSRDITITVIQTAPPPAAGDAEPPQPVTFSGNLLRIHRVQDGHRIDDERLAVDTAGAASETATTWTVTIENGDDAPLNIQSARLEMLERRLCFDSPSPARTRLYYGDPALSAPQYDYARLFALQPEPTLAVLGPEFPNPQFQPRPDTRPFTERHPALLWIALILIVLLLAVIALRAAKQSASPHT